MAEAKITITVDDDTGAGVAAVKSNLNKLINPLDSLGQKAKTAENFLDSLDDDIDNMGKSAGRATGKVKGLAGGMLTLNTRTKDFLKGLIGFAVIESIFRRVGSEINKFIGSIVEVNSKTENFMTTLETLTGTPEAAAKAFEELNKFARETPFQLEEIMDAFIKMKAGGLDPTVKTMKILGDTASALGGEKETFEGIARALAQMATKGKASAEELLQLQERGVPAMEILKEKLGLTAEQVSNIGRESVNAKKAIAAILEGLEERFGGQMERIADNWSGMVAELKSLWRDFLVLIGQAGFFDEIKKAVSDFRGTMREAFKTGEVKVWAKNISDSLVAVTKALVIVSKIIIEVSKLLSALASPIDSLVKGNEALNFSILSISKAFKNMVDASLKALDNMTEGVRNSLRQLTSDAIKSGRALVDNFVAGIKSRVSNALTTFKNFIGRIRRLLPSSPAKEGPLSDLDKVGPGFVNTIADGIRKTEPVLINEMERITAILNKVRNLNLSTSELLAKGPFNIAGDLAARTSIFNSSLSERDKMFAFEQVFRAGELRSAKFEQAQKVRAFDATSGTNIEGRTSKPTVNFNLDFNSTGGSNPANANDIDRQLAELWKGNRSQLRRAMDQ